jgi:hypothetical protein
MINRRDFLLSTGIGIVTANQIVHGRDDKFVTSSSFQKLIEDSNVGKGYDSVLGEYKNDIFTPVFREMTFPPYDDTDVFKFELSKSQSDFTRITSLSAKGKGSYGLAKVKASASVKTFFNANSYSCHLIGYFRKSANPYDSRVTSIEPRALEFIRTNRNNPTLLERQFGDEVITGFDLAAELIVIAEFQAESEEKKQEIATQISGSYKSGSGSAKFAQAVRSATSSKNTTILITGHLPDSKVDLTSEEEVIKFLTNFNTEYQSKQRITSYRTRGYGTLNALLRYPFVNRRNIYMRYNFASKLNSLYQNYVDWSANIDYVLDDNNRSQFEKDVIDQAQNDQKACKRDTNKIEEMHVASVLAWSDGQDWKSFYNPKLLESFREEFPNYKQKKTIVPPPPTTRRPPRPIRTPPDVRSDAGGARPR